MSPLSDDPDLRAKQLANLPNLRGEATAASYQPGASPNLRHGLRSRHPSQDVMDPALDAVIVDLEAKTEIRDASGEIPGWVSELCWTAGVKKLRVIRCSRFLAQHGDTDQHGKWRPENAELVKVADAYERSLERLAMTVASRAATGLNLARTVDLAAQLAELPEVAGDG